MKPLRLFINKEKPKSLSYDPASENYTELEMKENGSLRTKVKQTKQDSFPLKAIDKLLTHVSFRCFKGI